MTSPQGLTAALTTRSRWGPTTWQRLRPGLPAGAITIGLGFLASGVGAYAYLSLASHTLTPRAYGGLATLWSLTFMIWPGFFAVIDREAAKRISASADARHDVGPMRQVFSFAGVVLGVVLLAGVASFAALTHDAFAGNHWLTVDLLLAGPAIAAQYLSWGVLAGNVRFGSYSLLGATEGFARFAVAGALVLAGERSAGAFGLCLAVAPAVALCVVWPTLRRCRLTAASLNSTNMRQLMLLLFSFLFQSALVNSGPLLVHLISPGASPLLTGSFLSALVIVRVPLFLYNAAAAALMPSLSRSAAERRTHEFRRSLNQLVILVFIVAAVSIPLALSVGPFGVRALFGPRYALSGLALASLTATSALLILGSTFSVALTALGGVGRLFLSWSTGLAVLVASCFIPLHLIARVELALLLSAAVPVGAMAVMLYGRSHLSEWPASGIGEARS